MCLFVKKRGWGGGKITNRGVRVTRDDLLEQLTNTKNNSITQHKNACVHFSQFCWILEFVAKQVIKHPSWKSFPHNSQPDSLSRREQQHVKGSESDKLPSFKVKYEHCFSRSRQLHLKMTFPLRNGVGGDLTYKYCLLELRRQISFLKPSISAKRLH